VGLLDHYRQFAGMSDEEVSAELRERSRESRARALARIETLDLAGTHWHEFPHPDVVAAITFAARRALNRPPDAYATELRQEIARRHGLEAERVVVGHGAAQLLQSALRTLCLSPGDEVVLPWPAYRHLPAMVRRAGARAVPVAGGLDPDRLPAAVTERTRAVVLCNPNDPTGEWLAPERVEALADALPSRVWLLLDEALVDYAGPAAARASLPALDERPRLLVFRTLSKAYGLAGLRCGWALGPADAAEDLAGVAPAGALATPVQMGALEALVKCGALVERRRDQVAGERERLHQALASTPYDVPPSHANVLWLRLPGVNGPELAGRLARQAVRVAAGSAWGDDDHVRAQIQSPAATDRLLRALEVVAGPA
jgi:histidinol-phosphate aminotransferase